MTSARQALQQQALLLTGAFAVLATAALAALSGSGHAAPAKATAVPRSTSPPTIEGRFREGETVRAGNGIWANNPTSFTYQWQRCDNAARCTNVPGATSRRYTITSADVGQRLRVLVTATNADGSATANSRSSPVVAGRAAPALRSRPEISGQAQVGGQLTASPGTWGNRPTSFSYQWQQCNAAGGGCQNIGGATGQTYGVRAADAGRTLRVRVTATNQFGSATATSDRTQVIGGAAAPPTTSRTVLVTQVALPDRLVISGVQFSPRTIQSRAPFIARFRVTDTRNRIVQGALVYAVGVPFGRVTSAPEAATDANGWATFTFRPLARFQLVRGYSIVFFVRARKPGDNVLAGVSSRRLVQVRVG